MSTVAQGVTVQSALTKSRLFLYCVNPRAGCAHACVYCNAPLATRLSHPGEQWGSFVDLIQWCFQKVLHRSVRPSGHFWRLRGIWLRLSL